MDLDGLKRDDIAVELMLLNKSLRLTSFEVRLGAVKLLSADVNP